MSKILKNNTGSEVLIDDVGQSIQASGQITISVTDYILYANSTDVQTLIANATLTVNDGTSDLSAVEGANYIKYPDNANNILFTDTTSGLTSNTAREAIDEAALNADTALNTPRYTISLQHNGTVSNNTFFGYSNLIPGDDTPIVIPIKSELTEFTFSNEKSGADYGLEFRKNSSTASVFYSVSKDNTQFFNDSTISQSFLAGDTIFVKYKDEGSNASDVGIILFFKAVP